MDGEVDGDRDRSFGGYVPFSLPLLSTFYALHFFFVPPAQPFLSLALYFLLLNLFSKTTPTIIYPSSCLLTPYMSPLLSPSLLLPLHRAPRSCLPLCPPLWPSNPCLSGTFSHFPLFYAPNCPCTLYTVSATPIGYFSSPGSFSLGMPSSFLILSS